MRKAAKKFLSELVNSIGPSGYEGDVADVWRAEARTFADTVETDVHGNSRAVINPGGGIRVMLAGHYDEIGFLVTHIDDQGFLRISPVGGWDAQIAQGQRVKIRGRKETVYGVIGKAPIHLQKSEERKKVPDIRDLWIDIGSTSKAGARRRVEVGDPVVVDRGLDEWPGGRAAGKALDDRAGAFVILETARRLARRKIEAEVHAVATVQEEIGLRGARTAAFGIEPQIGIAVDVTFATDHPGLGEVVQRNGKTTLGGGPVVTRGPNIHPKIFDLFMDTARREDIPVQVAAESRGTGTDANAIQLNRAGVAAGLLGIPLRYMHSPCEIVDLKDLDRAVALLTAVTARLSTQLDLKPF